MFKAICFRLLLLAVIVSAGYAVRQLRHRMPPPVRFCMTQGSEDKLSIREGESELTLRGFGSRIRELAAAEAHAVELDGCGSVPIARLTEMWSYCRRCGLPADCVTLLNAAPIAEEDTDLLPPVYLTLSLRGGQPVLNYEEADITLPQFKNKLRQLVEKEEDQPVVFIAEDELTEQQWEDIIGSCMEDVRGFDNYGIEAPDRSYPYRRIHRHTAD